ncbi:NERD domain-containing protein [Oscillospiraceae bacterium OttesenSCG-928-F05]|nr:NERD domain-containing protein [Oscillospiraceae bacterium OttesenSCG-928-F05]
MAKMIPAHEDDFNNSFGERQVFAALRDGLPDDYTVFHSFRWNRRAESGRIEWGETDFTVFHPAQGFLVIEVKSGGIILEDGRWQYERTDNHKRYPMKDPLEQAGRTTYMIKRLAEEALSGGDYCWAEPVVWFPSISDRALVSAMPNTYHPEIVFMDWALDHAKQAVDNAYRFYDSARRTRLSPESEKRVINALAPAFSAVPSLGALYAEQEHDFLRLTAEQNGLLDYLEEQPTAVIQGSAGTGKTLLAVEKARRLSEDGRVLFLCFNRFLMEELRRKNQGTAIAFYNLPSLMVRETGFSGTPTDDDITSYLNQYDAVGNWDYKHIIVDEGQDFDDAHLGILSAIAQLAGGAFYVFYDKNQLVQRRELPEWVRSAECRLVLRRNCRNTHSIATTAGRPIDVAPVLWEKCPQGKTPSFHLAGGKDAVVMKLEALIATYLEAKIPMDQIVVLTAKTEERSLLSGTDRIGKWPLVRSRGETGLLFTTARKFKGLEAAAVIVVDVDATTFGTPEERNLFYVGASRAKDFLDIVADLDAEALQALGDTLNGGTPIKNAAAKVASALKVRMMKQARGGDKPFGPEA